MKKTLTVLAAALFALSMAAASAQVYEQPQLGLSIDVPEDLTDITFNVIMDDDDDALGLNVYFLNADVMTPLLEACQTAKEAQDQAAYEKALNEYLAAADANTEYYATVIGLPTEDLETSMEARGLNDVPVEEMGVNGDYTYFRIKYELPEDTLLSEESKKLFEEHKEAGHSIADGMSLIPIVDAELASAVGSFTTTDMNGNTVDESLFANADITVLNVWATTCNPCVSELPEMNAWAKELPENVQIVGLLSDVNELSGRNFERAQKIIAKAGVGYTNLITSKDLQDFASRIVGTPTTFFIGRDGNAVHEPVVGAAPEEYKQIVEEFLAK